MWGHAEHDQEEAARVRKAVTEGDRLLIDRLLPLTRRGTYERALLSRDPAGFDATDWALLRRLTWHYRTQLPAWLRPALNPDDPIVREMDQSDA